MSNLVLALEITTLGMGLVFAALILLWWMMALLTSLIADKESVSPTGTMSDSAEPSPALPGMVGDHTRGRCAPDASAGASVDQTQGRPVSVTANDDKARVAAIAVAFALAQEETARAHALSDPPTAIISAWQLGTRTKQLYQKGERIKRQPFKIGP